MAEIVITPRAPEDMEVGAFKDDSGDRFVGLSFKMANNDHVVVTFTPALFAAYAEHLTRASAQFAAEDYWRDV